MRKQNNVKIIIPKQIVLCSKVYKIKFVKNFTCKSCKNGFYGRVDTEKATIFLEAELKKKPVELLATLYHEIAHVFNYYFMGCVEQDETFANTFASFLASINNQIRIQWK